MPVPAFGFLAGDIFSSVELIIEVGKTPRELAGSAKIFRHQMVQLRTFEMALIGVRRYVEGQDSEENVTFQQLVCCC